MGASGDPPANAGDIRVTGSISGSGRSPGEGNGNALQYSCQENLMDRGTWQATDHGAARVGHDLACVHAGFPAAFIYKGLLVAEVRGSLQKHPG